MMDWEHDDTVRTIIRRARFIKLDDDGTQQKVELSGLKNEQMKKIVRVQAHGISSHPPKDSEAVIIQLGGRTDRTMVLGGEHKDKRPKNLTEGQAVLYDDKGNVVFAKGADGLAIHAKEGKVYVKPASGQNVYLGGDGSDGTYAKVETVSGPAMNVYARIG